MLLKALPQFEVVMLGGLLGEMVRLRDRAVLFSLQ